MHSDKLIHFSRYFCLLFGVILISCSQKSSDEYTINAVIEGYGDGTAYFQIFERAKKPVILDSATVKDGKFTMKGTVGSPKQVNLSLKPGDASTSIFLENSLITIEGDISEDNSSIEEVKISGSAVQDEYEKMNDTIYGKLDKKMELLEAKIAEASNLENKKQLEKELEELRGGFRQTVSTNRRAYIRSNTNSFVAPYALEFETGYNPENVEELQALLDNMNEDVKASPYYAKAKEQIDILQRLREGNEAPSLDVITLENNSLTNKSLKGQVYLIDFWATWCIPCIESFPGLKELYAEYHDDGFEIITVSVDEKRQVWVDGVKEYDLPWLNAHIFYPKQNKKQELIKRYAVNHYPKTYLVNKDGKVVASDIKKSRIEEYLKNNL